MSTTLTYSKSHAVNSDILLSAEQQKNINIVIQGDCPKGPERK